MDPREQWERDYAFKNSWRRDLPPAPARNFAQLPGCSHPSGKHCLCYDAGCQCCTCGQCKGDR